MVVVLEPSSLTGTGAILRGDVTEAGNDPPAVAFFYGAADGGTDPAGWPHAVSAGMSAGAFAAQAIDLSPETGYVVRARATNLVNTAWSEPLAFTTPAHTPPTVVINKDHYDQAEKTVPAEFIELHNPGAEPANLSGWAFTSGIGFAFPADTEIPPGGYLVIAEDPATVQARFGFSRRARYVDRQAAQQRRRCRTAGCGGQCRRSRRLPCQVPLAIVGEPPSPSIELVHPLLDNELGSSWRPSGSGGPSPIVPQTYVGEADANWSYRKGPNRPPNDGAGRAWFDLGYTQDAAWLTGRTPVGYGDGDDNTVLDDMQGNYITAFLRHDFTIAAGQIPPSLQLRVYHDDGAIVWINGREVGRYSVNSGDIADPPPENFAIGHEAGWSEETLLDVSDYLVEGTNVLAVQALNVTLDSSDMSADAALATGEITLGGPPTPGARNSVFGQNAPPAMRQVDHTPKQPRSGEPVAITAKITDSAGVGGVTLRYQAVAPGDYIKRDDPRYATDWVAVPMFDDGTGSDAVAGDSLYTAAIPGAVQQHRWLIRYRITAEDGTGVAATAPYPDDPSPNFAYFCYDGLPAWTARAHPSASPVTYSPELLGSLPTYHLITTRQEHEDAQFIPDSSRGAGYTGSEYLWQGALVYDGEVYDHIRFRARGGVWRYSMGKNMWKFRFERGHRFEARDDYGRKYDAPWKKLNFSALIQQGNFLQRGEQGLFEWAGFKLHNLAGNPAPKTHFVHFRIIEHADENGATASQYDDDFQGLYLAIEQMDGQFLDEHKLPDGNLYKMEGGTGELNNQGPTQPSDKADLNAFFAYKTSAQPVDWWRQNLDLPDYYSFRSIM
ncbi:MAG: lamin tail domain-containing protein, partial [Verrucomicrobiales bacterium]